MTAEAILALDQGSSSTRCIAYDRGMCVIGSAARPVATRRPAPGMVEHDPADILDGALAAVREVATGLNGRVAALGIADQTESFVVWERDTGRAVSPVVSWQDTRAGDVCETVSREPAAAAVPEITGLALEPTFSAPKLRWLFDRDEGLQRRAEAGELLFGDVACWLAWHLSGGAVHATEPSNACRTLLLGLDSLDWDERLLDLFGVPAKVLPAVRPSDAPGMETSSGVTGFEAPIAAMLGDQPAALFGQGCTRPGMAALTLGTGAFLWLNAGAARPAPPDGVLATVAWERSRAGRAYALEAFCANAGNALGVLRGMGFTSANGTGAPDWQRPHPVVVPAPAGLGTPRWHDADRITVLDASSATTSDDLAAAGVAGVAHQIADALEAVGARAAMLRVGGGLAAHHGLVQAVADLSGRELEVTTDLEVTARGIAALAAAAAGLLEGEAAEPAVAGVVRPALDPAGRERERARWQQAVNVHVGAPAAS